MKASSRTLFIIMVVAFIIVITSMYFLGKPSFKGNVSLGVEFNAHAAPFWELLEDNSFEKNGINVTQVMKFKTGMELAAAVARGDNVMGQACLGPMLIMIDRGIPVRIVDKVHDGGFALVVNPTEIRSLEDLTTNPYIRQARAHSRTSSPFSSRISIILSSLRFCPSLRRKYSRD